MSTEEAKPVPSDQPAPPKPTPAPLPASKNHRVRNILIAVAALVLLFIIVPRIVQSWHTVSTDDAYVNSYVTFVAPRIIGQVTRVLVEDNNRVKKGDLLVELDREPYRIQVAIKQAAVDAAQANLVVAEATVRGEVAATRSLRFKLNHAIEDVDNQVALIRARAATWEQAKATQVFAQSEFDRAKRLLATKVTTPEDLDQKREALDVANAQVTEALEKVYQARAALGLPGKPPEGTSVTDVPGESRSNFFLGPPGTGRIDAKRRPAWRRLIVLESHAAAGSGGILQARSGRRYQPHLCRSHQECARSKTSPGRLGASTTRSRPGEARA